MSHADDDAVIARTRPAIVALVGTLDTKGAEHQWVADRLHEHGDAVYIPANTLHSTFNTTWQPLRLVVIYTPGGAEKQVDELPDVRILEPGVAPTWKQDR